MNVARRLLGLLGLVVVLGLTPIALAAGGVGWGSAIEVPGMAALGSDRPLRIESVSCRTTGNCAAGGYYTDSSNQQQAFVVDESNGTWGSAIEVPGTAALNLGDSSIQFGAEVFSVSCTGAGNCVTGGRYLDSANRQVAFLAEEARGVWGSAIAVPGLAALNLSDAAVTSVSCPSRGNCAAAGYYLDADQIGQMFVVDQRNGVWGTAKQVPGTEAGTSYTSLISCASAGNCVTVSQAFFAEEKNGVWRKAHTAPRGAALDSISCPSNANCTTGGFGLRRAFVISEKHGVWGAAKVLTKLGSSSETGSLSCPSAGNCVAGGTYYPASPYGPRRAFVVTEKRGVWGKARSIAVGGTVGSDVQSVSCASTGNCAAVGDYYLQSRWHAFVIAEKNGYWQRATEVPGTAALNPGDSSGYASISCAKTGSCGIGGGSDNHDDYNPPTAFHAFVTSP